MNAAEPTPPTQPSVDPTSESLFIEGITEPTIINYFKTLNASNFEATAALFATDGVMQPPFESGIVGPEAIAAYLHQEAKGMKLEPHQGVIEIIAAGQTQVQVAGKVQTPLFGVNVSWLFVLNPQHDITYTRIKLLASPQELLNIRR